MTAQKTSIADLRKQAEAVSKPAIPAVVTPIVSSPAPVVSKDTLSAEQVAVFLRNPREFKHPLADRLRETLNLHDENIRASAVAGLEDKAFRRGQVDAMETFERAIRAGDVPSNFRKAFEGWLTPSGAAKVTDQSNILHEENFRMENFIEGLQSNATIVIGAVIFLVAVVWGIFSPTTFVSNVLFGVLPLLTAIILRVRAGFVLNPEPPASAEEAFSLEVPPAA